MTAGGTTSYWKAGRTKSMPKEPTKQVHRTGAIVGFLVHYPGRGWRFNPAVAGRRGSRKFYETKEQAVPRWVGKHTLEDVQ